MKSPFFPKMVFLKIFGGYMTTFVPFKVKMTSFILNKLCNNFIIRNTKPDLTFCAGSTPVRDLLEVCDVLEACDVLETCEGEKL